MTTLTTSDGDGLVVPPRQQEEEEEVLDVIIIGAGFAGLSAGRKLLEAQQQTTGHGDVDGEGVVNKGGKSNLKFVILEGRNEIGGRCRTITLKDGKSLGEIGAQWIHDSHEANVITRLATESGIDTKACDRKSGILYTMMQQQQDEEETEEEKNKKQSPPQYRSISQDEFQTQHEQWMDTFLEYQDKLRKKKADNDEVDISLEECLQDFIQKKQQQQRQSKMIPCCCCKAKNMSVEDRAWLYYFIDSEIIQEYAASLQQLSLFHWDDDEIDDQDEHVDLHLAQNVERGGYMAVIDHLAQPLLDDNKLIRCNCKVTSIDWKPTTSAVAATQAEEDQDHDDDCVVKVYYEDTSNDGNGVKENRCMKARKVLLTVPLGVLKAKTINFHPELPESKQMMIDKIGYGCLNKCIMLWDENDIDKLPWPLDKEWVERIVLPQDDDNRQQKQKQQGIWTEFYNCYPMNQRPMLIGFLAGQNAVRIEETYTDQEIQQQALQALREWFGGVGTTTSGSSSSTTINIPDPIQVVVTRWNKDEYSRGSYSYNAVGGKHRFRHRLADPVERRLYFAGEACHGKYPSTTQGAYLSGQTAGELLLKDFC